MNMENIEKIKITEQQYKMLMTVNETAEKKSDEEVYDEYNKFQQKVADVSSGKKKEDEKDKVEENETTNIYENVSKTFGNLEVRNLIKEGNEIKGEVKSSYGVWGKQTWTENGEANGYDNVFTKLTYKLQL